MAVPRTHLVDAEALAAYDALPLSVQIVDYTPPVRILWANTRCLQDQGMTLEIFCNMDVSANASEEEKALWQQRYEAVQQRGETLTERMSVPNPLLEDRPPVTVDTSVTPIRFRPAGGGGEPLGIPCVLVSQWPAEVKSKLESYTLYMTSLLDCSPYPLCFFTFDGHLITCNPAAVAVFGKTIWLQSDIFGMGERERRGLSAAENRSMTSSFRIERTERRTAYENMMDALDRDGATFSVDLPIRRTTEDGTESLWYCRVFAQRHKDPITGEPIIMISHQDVTNLRKVEGELGRMEMAEHANKELVKQHDSDVAGSLLMLLGESFNGRGGRFQGGDDEDDLADGHPPGGAGIGGGAGPGGDGSSGGLGGPGGAGTGMAAGAVCGVAKSVQLNGLRAVLELADDWSFDVFELEREADGMPLQVVTWSVLCKHNLIEEFNLDPVRLVNFLRTVEAGHNPDNPYHNAVHVAGVVQSMHCLLTRGGLARFAGKLEALAGILAACIHDYEHRGLNNDFLVKSVDDWAISSNDKSPNENHHLSAGFRVLLQPDCNFIYRMPQAQQQQLRKLIIDMVLATDMAEHMAVVSRLRADLQKRLEEGDGPDSAGGGAGGGGAGGGGGGGRAGWGGEIPDAIRTLVMQGAIKMADIGHLYAVRDVHIRWSERLEEEMWKQGDVEKDRAMKVSFLMDRDKPGVTKSQPGFVDFVVRPLFETWVACFPECQILMDRIDDNYRYWKSKEAAPPADSPRTDPPPAAAATTTTTTTASAPAAGAATTSPKRG